MTEAVECVVVGAGMVGLAVAGRWRSPGARLSLASSIPCRRRAGSASTLTLGMPEQARFGPDVEWIDGVESPGLTASLALADQVAAMLDTPAESAFARGAVQS